MLARVNGGNSGIIEYLENGIKNGRDYSRDELDKRVTLMGNMELTDSIINSIDDKGQDRYLHITLSFREKEVSNDLLQLVCQDYIDLAFSGYSNDEFNCYAEAHLPKIQNIQDKKTGNLIERKPHIHIVIPRVNLLSHNKLNPFGNYNKDVKYFKAIQEKINNKYNLESPQDFKRGSIDHLPEILSRIKGDLFNEKNANFKLNLFEMINNNEFKSSIEFEKHLADLGEVKIRNADKPNEYYAIKLFGESRFINLKNPVFSKGFIDNNKGITFSKMSDKDINYNTQEWIKRVSRENKYIVNSSSSLRTTYYNLTKSEKEEFLNEQERQYNLRFREHGNNESSITIPKRKNLSHYTNRLSKMSERTLVYGVRGHEQFIRGRDTETPEINVFLHDNESGYLANSREKQYASSTLRRNLSDTERRLDSEPGQIINDYINSKFQDNDLDKYKEIRLNLKADFFLEYLQNKCNINPNDYSFKYAKDGSARINTGKLNLNPSDFLTKHLNLEWKEAKLLLSECYSLQKENSNYQSKPIIKIENWTKYNSEYRQGYYSSIKQAKKEIRSLVRTLKSQSFDEYRDDKNRIYQQYRTKEERKGYLSIVVFEKLKKESLINEYKDSLLSKLKEMESKPEIENYIDYLSSKSNPNFQSIESFVTNYFNEAQKEFKMAISDLVRKFREDKEENSFSSGVSHVKLDKLKQFLLEEEEKTKLKLNLKIHDIIAGKPNKRGHVEYFNAKDQEKVFVDRGDKIVFDKKTQNPEQIAVGLELALKKYGGNLNLRGSKEFKTMTALVAAEKNLNIIFTPEEYNKIYNEERERIKSEQEKNNKLEQFTFDDKPVDKIIFSKENEKFEINFFYKNELVDKLSSLDEIDLESAVGEKNAKTIIDSKYDVGELSGKYLFNDYCTSPSENQIREQAKEERKGVIEAVESKQDQEQDDDMEL